MHLMYQLDAEGKRVYTLTVRFWLEEFMVVSLEKRPLQELAKEADLSAIVVVNWKTVVLTEQSLYPSLESQKENSLGVPSISAHPARFSPDDKFSKERLTCKKRFNLLPTQQPPKEY